MRANRDGVVTEEGARDVCDTALARNELGFTSRGPVLTLKDTVDDLRRRGVA